MQDHERSKTIYLQVQEIKMHVTLVRASTKDIGFFKRC